MRKQPLSRIRILGYFFSVFCALIFLQMVRIQTSASAKNLESWAADYSYDTREIQSERGYIYDRTGHLLAGNKEVYELGVEVRYMSDPEAIASTLATVAGLDYNDILTRIQIYSQNENQVYIKLADFVESSQIETISTLKTQYAETKSTSKKVRQPSLSGLVWFPHLKRIYPEKTLASNILGFYTYKDRSSGSGFYGVEEKYNNLLAGQKLTVSIPMDPYKMVNLPTVPPGASLILTIDREIQAMVEKNLDEAIKSSGAKSGAIIVMDPKTGELLAIGSTPRMDPNEYWKLTEIFPTGTPFNKAVNQVYEPGSIFKILTMAAALDSGAVTPSTTFTDTGTIEIGGITIYNWNRGAWGEQDMIGCLQHSLNVCLTWVAKKTQAATFYQYMDAFGIGHRSNVDLAGEEVFPLSVPGDPTWYQVNLGTNSFGQGVAVTPMQMVMATSALANDGKMVAPHVLRAFVQNGKQYNTNPVVVGMPISEKTAHTITEMLAISLEEESSNALVEGYRVAGKTGTAQIVVNGRYDDNITNASFIGWGPVDDPRFLVFVWLEKPTTSPWGSVVASPVFRDVVQELVVLLNLPPDKIRQQLEAK